MRDAMGTGMLAAAIGVRNPKRGGKDADQHLSPQALHQASQSKGACGPPVY